MSIGIGRNILCRIAVYTMILIADRKVFFIHGSICVPVYWKYLLTAIAPLEYGNKFCIYIERQKAVVEVFPIVVIFANVHLYTDNTL